MRIAVDALSVTNLSGRRVLLGHLTQMALVHPQRHHFVVLIHSGNRDLIRPLGEHVHWQLCPHLTRHWTGRVLWQLLCLEPLLRRLQIDLLMSPTGALNPGTRRPQIVLAQNPWCFIRAYHRGLASRIKAALQRREYRMAQRRAVSLFANSRYLADLYRANAGFPRCEPILANGIDEAIFAAAHPTPSFARRLPEVITVSVMTPHKAIEEVLAAFVLLRQHGVDARLRLVGPWANPSYRRQIERQIRRDQLQDHVIIHDYVSDLELQQLYRQARVFVLLSRCESFGLPAVEAQAFGTPSVVAYAAAAPEVAGPGGLVVPPADPVATAAALQTLLCNPAAWQQASHAACANAQRFRWQRVSQPLTQLLSIVSG